MNFEQVKNKADNALMPTYAHFSVALEKGKGATLTDVEGKEYIDFTSGIGVNSLGYADEGWINAITEQAKKLAHTSNLYYNPTVAEFAQTLCEKSGFDKAFLCNSGAEANECAFKLARKYSFDKYGEGRNEIISLVNSFHGRTMATITATGQEEFHKYFFPFNDGFKYAKANDFEAFKAAISEKTCAVIMEPIQGEAGVFPIEKDFAKAVAELCREKDIVLIFDEVQTGVARTGKLYAWENLGVKPDVLTSAKGLGGGLPIGACLAMNPFGEVLTSSTHGTTFGGNPIVCAGGLEVLSRIDENMLEEVNKKAEYIKEKLSDVEEIAEIRGMGLMIGLSLKNKTAKEVAAKCLEKGLMILTAHLAVRMLPPLVISYEEIDIGIAILKSVLDE
ncbi:MAG: aspartate aminotransferase family protein [Clostridiales bacterium]|nr:aspartate aminotransferase family protein [Clostridiales bacterium]